MKLSRIQEDKDVHDGKTCVQGVLAGYQTLIELQREQEKTVWMLNAYLGK